ncbi:MAG TPA: hypothetical protein VHS31_16855 [Tepidisphaeraceae bacterium]|jgi:hypothetical protein|nr:hypothetical protein [Tepidisphaeraceae bacterium]
MRPRTITLPELGMIAGTRAALGAGIALLLADQMDDEQRRAVGWTLLAVGALSTIPLAAEIMHKNGAHSENGHTEEPSLQEARFKV